MPTGEVTLPSKISGNTITSVNCNLGNKVTKLIIPGCIKKVFDVASDNTNLREVILQEGVEQLGYNDIYSYRPFAGCKNLSSVQLPRTLKLIEELCFYGCQNLRSISLPEGLTKIGFSAFENTGLKSVVIPSTVTELLSGAFSGSDLEEVTVKCGEEGWGFAGGQEAFAYCEKLENVILNEKTNDISYRMFKGCTALKSITLPQGLKEIGSEAFSGCTSLAQVVIPSDVESVENRAFYGCTSLTKAVILGSVTEIAGSLFEGCKKLKSVFIPMTVNKIGDNAFRDCVNFKDIYYPLNEAAWANIVIDGSGNGFLLSANLHTNASPAMV